MAISKEKKKKILQELKEKIERQKTMIFVDFTGLKVKDFSILRKRLKERGDEIKVVKKTLAQLAFNEKGLKVEIEKMKGELALVFGYQDEVLPAKLVWQFSKENSNLKILGGLLENNFLESEKIIEIAQLPTREELIKRLVGSVSAPILNLANALKSNLRKLIFILSQIKGQVKIN